MNDVFPDTLLNQLKSIAIIAVLTVERLEDAVPLARALTAGGIGAMELTLRTPVALDALESITSEVPKMLVGVGTVLMPDQVLQVKERGAAFAVAPGMNPRVAKAARDAGVPFAPGIATPSDIEAAIECGCTLLKYFPAETAGGLKHLVSMATPYKHLGLSFIPLGGINLDNAELYLANPLITAIGGSWIAPTKLIAAGDWAAIEANARAARDIADRLCKSEKVEERA